MEKNYYSIAIVNTIKRCLAKHGFDFSFDKTNGVFCFSEVLSGSLQKINCRIEVRTDEYLVYASAPVWANPNDTSMISEMAKYLCHANYDLKNGSFDMNLNFGEIRYKCHTDCRGIVPSDEIVESSILSPGKMFELFGEGIAEIILRGASAMEAIMSSERTHKERLYSMLSTIAEHHEDEETGQMLSKLISNWKAWDNESGGSDTFKNGLADG